MGWQAPNYVYAKTPDPPNHVKEFIDGAKDTMKMVGTGLQVTQAVKGIAKQEAFDSEIAGITAEADKKLEALKTPEAAPATAPMATPQGAGIPAAGAPAPQITGDKALAMANMAPAPTATPAPTAPVSDETQTKRIEINADMHNKIIKAYYKHGKIEEAQVMEAKYMDQTVKLATIDHKAAQKVWNSSFLKDRYGEIDLTPKPKWKVIQGRDGNPNMVYDEHSVEKPTLESKDQFITMKEGETRVLVTPDGKGGYTAVEVAKGAPKTASGDGLRKYEQGGEEVTEEFVDGEWRVKAKSPKGGGSIKDGKTAQKHLDDWFVQKYAGDMVEETGKAPDKNTVLAKNGNKAVEGKMINGKPVPLQELHDAMQAYYERQIEGGAKPAEALNNTLQFGQQYGSTKKETDFSKVTPAQYEQAGVDKATVSTINAKIAEYKKKGVNLKDVRINKKGGYIEYVPDKGEAERVLISKPAAKAAAKSTTPAKTAEKPTEKPAEKPATTPAAQPAAKAAAAQKSTVSDLEKKTGIGGTDDKQIAEATRKKRIEKLTKEIDQKSIDAQVEEVASYQSRRFGVPIGFARKRARALIEKEIAAKKTELASLQK